MILLLHFFEKVAGDLAKTLGLILWSRILPRKGHSRVRNHLYQQFTGSNRLQLEKTVSDKSRSKDETFEALTFITAVIKEHDKDLEKLVKELSSKLSKMNEKDRLSERLDRIEDKIDRMQVEIKNLLKSR